MMRQKTQIVVLGAGYAGMMAALRLSGKTRRLRAGITLVNGVDTFIQRPRLHQVAVGQLVPQTSIRTMIRGTRVHFLQGWVSAIDLGDRLVTVRTTHSMEQVNYDFLVYALGSMVDQESVPGVHEHACVLDPRGANSAAALCEKLRLLSQTGGNVVVVGSGATGIEGVTEIKGRFPNLRLCLVTDGIFGSFKGARVERHFREAFLRQDISIHEGQPVRAVEAGRLIFANGKPIPFDLCLWAGGFRASSLAREAEFAVNERGQILTDPFGRSISHPDVYAVGDASHPVEEPGNPMRMSLLTAITRGAHAADNITARLYAREEAPLSFAYYGQGIAMGPKDAVGFFGYPDDQPHGPILRGKAAVAIRDFFVWLIFFVLELERRMPGFYLWLGKRRYAALRRAQRLDPGVKPSATR